VKLRVEADELELIHIAIVPRIAAVVATRVLHLDGKAKGIDHIMDADVGPRAMQKGIIETGLHAAEVVIAVFVAKAVVEAEIEPRGVFEEVDPRVRRMADILRRIGITRRAVALRMCKSEGLRQRGRR
jgi:hypothetical protein